MMLDLFDFSKENSTLPEDRWLRLMIRAGFVLFILCIEAVIVITIAKLLWKR